MTHDEIVKAFPFMNTKTSNIETLDLGARLYNTLCQASGIEFENELEVLTFLKGKYLATVLSYEINGHDLITLREWVVAHVHEKMI